MSRRSLAANGALVLLALAVGLGLAEALLRAAGAFPRVQIPPYLYAEHPETWWTLRPGFEGTVETPDGPVTYRINAQGIRANRPTVIDPAATDLIFLIGDSATFGQGLDVEHTAAARLPPLLRGEGRAPQVINLGVSGFGTMHTRKRLAEYSRSLAQPTVVLYLFVPNDPVDNLSGEKVVVNGVRMDTGMRMKPLMSLVANLYSRLRIVSVPVDFYYDRFGNPRFRKQHQLAESGTDLAQREDVRALQRHLQDLIDFTAREGIRFAVFESRESEYSEPLATFLATRDIPLVRCADLFRRAGVTDADIRLKEGHWNGRGNAIVAQGMAGFLRGNGWLRTKR